MLYSSLFAFGAVGRVAGLTERLGGMCVSSQTVVSVEALCAGSAALVTAGVVALSELPASAVAAPTTPPSTVQCSGTITPDAGGPAAGNPNPFDYSFSCAPPISGATDPSGYTLELLRQHLVVHDHRHAP